MSSLEERLEGTSATPWIPDAEKAAKYGKDHNADNPLIGIFVDHYVRTNFRGDGFYDVVVLLVNGQEVAVHCQATVLASQMHEARPVFGERVGVKYLGERQGASATYADYKVKVDREVGGAVKWADADPSTASETTPSTTPTTAAESPVNPASASTELVPSTSPDDDIPF